MNSYCLFLLGQEPLVAATYSGEALPEYLQKRDMTKLGRKGGTKYKDMRSEDTGAWGSFANDGRGGGSSRRFDGGDDRFRPDEVHRPG